VGNLTRVTDWANRTTTYTYDENNNVTGITKPNGSTVTTVYDESQRSGPLDIPPDAGYKWIRRTAAPNESG